LRGSNSPHRHLDLAQYPRGAMIGRDRARKINAASDEAMPPRLALPGRSAGC
jgi:hypothetical protein